MIVTTIAVSVKPENIDDFIKATLGNHQHSVKEPENLRFDVLQVKDDPGLFTLYEAYSSEEAALAHKNAAHYLKWRKLVAPWMAVPGKGTAHKVFAPLPKILNLLKQAKIKIKQAIVKNEPSPQQLDSMVENFRLKEINCVAAIGGYFDVPHGIICAALTPESVKINIKQLREKGDDVYLQKYAKVGKIFANQFDVDMDTACDFLIKELKKLVQDLNIPMLGSFGINENSLDKIIASTSNKNNPVKLSARQIRELLLNCL